MKRLTKTTALLVALLMLSVTLCFVACSPYSGHYTEVGADELESKSEQLEAQVNTLVNGMLYNDMMPNYKVKYSLSAKTDYPKKNFSTETKVEVTQYGYEGLKQSKIKYHGINIVNETEFTILGVDPVLEERNFTVTFWYGEELEHIYYELIIDGKKEQGIMPYDYGKEELKIASHYDIAYQRYIKYDTESAISTDYKLYLDGENKVKIDSLYDDGTEKHTYLIYLIFNDDDTVHFKTEQEHTQSVRGSIGWDYSASSTLEITPSKKKVTVPNFD